MKYLLTLFILSLTYTLSAQDKQERMLPAQGKYTAVMEDFGNPLPGDPILIVNYFAQNEGSYLWFFNHGKAKSKSYLNNNPVDIYAGIYLEDHGGLLEIISFKDFAGTLSEPRFLLDYCLAADADQNGSPEFYLTYFMESDGLDAKPLKVIVYSKSPADKGFTKAKLTAWIPFQEEDAYRREKDGNFNALNKATQAKAEALLRKAQDELK